MNTFARSTIATLAAALSPVAVLAQTDDKPVIRTPVTTPAQSAPTGSTPETAPAKAAQPAAATPAPAPVPLPKPAQVMNPPFGMFKDAKLPMIQRSVLNGVEGRIDHMGVDLISGRLYVAAKNKGSVEMLDVQGSKQQPAITELPEPAGMVVVSDLRRLVVACGGDNSVRVFKLNDQGDPTPDRTVKFDGETDAVRYDAATKRVYVGHGWNLGSFSLESGERGPSLNLGSSPEGFVIDPGSNRIYVNMAQKASVAVLERSDSGELKLVATWALKDVKGNYPMALDPSLGHLFIVTRNPAKLLVVDTKSGEQVAAVECTDDADDCWWDMVQKRIYVSCGGNGGFVDCYQQSTEGGKVGYKRYHQERTNVGCRTSVFTPEHRRLIVAAPTLGGDPTFIYVFLVGP